MNAAKKRLMLWLLIAGVMLVALALAFRPIVVMTDIATAVRGELLVSVDEEGETRMRDVFVVSAPVAGLAQRIVWRVGDSVTANTSVITEIEPSDADFLNPRSQAQAEAPLQASRASYELAVAEVERAEAELSFAREEVLRARALIVDGAIATRVMDDAERTFATAQATLKTQQAALQVQRVELERAKAALISPSGDAPDGEACMCIPVSAPVSGPVLRVLHESAGSVSAGEPLVEIGDPGSLEIVVDLLSTDAVRVRPGHRVIIDDWGGPLPLAGIVQRVEPYGYTRVSSLGIEEQRVNVVVDFSQAVDVEARLGHGYRIVARIVLSEQTDVLTVPLTALFRDNQQWVIFAIENGRARQRSITVGAQNSFRAVVTEGLSEGEQFVVYPSERIEDGVRIAARP